MIREYDVAIAGLGAMGSAASISLAERGCRMRFVLHGAIQ